MSEAGPAVAARPGAQAQRSGWRIALDGAPFAIAVLTLAMIATAGVIGLTEPTETRYAEIAREMHASGEWLVPRESGFDDPAAETRIIVNRDSVDSWLSTGRRVWVLGPEQPSEEMARSVGAAYAPISRWREFTLG